MRKAMLYGVATIILLWVAKETLTAPDQTQTTGKVKEIAARPTEKFVALKMAEVKWPKEKKVKPKQPSPTPKPALKPKTPKPPKATSQGRPARGNQNGGYNIVGDFQCSVHAYLQHMRRQGAMVVIYDGQKKRFWELNASGTPIPIRKLSGRYSPQTRRLTDDYPDKASLISSVTAKYGQGNYEILLLIPEALDQQIKISIETIIKKRVTLSQLTAVHLTYRQEGSAFTASIDWGLVNGKKVSIGQSITI